MLRMVAALADDLGDFILAVFELVAERRARGFFQRIEIFALDVLDDRK